MLTQAQADELLALEKRAADNNTYAPVQGSKLTIPLQSVDGSETFVLDVNRHQIKVTKATFQNRSRQVVILARLDLDGPPHQNPDGEIIPCPHLHLYREGYNDKWAIPLPAVFTDPTDIVNTLFQFMTYCNVTQMPNITLPLF